jgi:pimeloyl-ACP methyl ester carboxylesterase
MPGAKSIHKHPLRLLTYLLVAAALSIALIALLRASFTYAGDALARRYPAPGRVISVDGHRLSLYCTGSGSPPVIVESGLGVDWTGWRLVMPKLAELTQVCVYDRAGYGGSDPGLTPRTALRISQELNGMLRAAKVDEPYILLAHSFGGYVARLYAANFGDSLAGVVLAEPSHEDEPPLTGLDRQIRALLPPMGFERLVRLYRGVAALPPELQSAPASFQYRYMNAPSVNQIEAARQENAALPQTQAEARAASFPRNLPLTVITALHIISPRVYYPSPVPEPPANHRELQSRLAHLSLHGQQIIAADSGHSVQLDQPELIVEAVRNMIDARRGLLR